jgi:hypothetical protein
MAESLPFNDDESHLIDARERARCLGQFELSDAYRVRLYAIGILVKDTKQGGVYTRIDPVVASRNLRPLRELRRWVPPEERCDEELVTAALAEFADELASLRSACTGSWKLHVAAQDSLRRRFAVFGIEETSPIVAMPVSERVEKSLSYGVTRPFHLGSGKEVPCTVRSAGTDFCLLTEDALCRLLSEEKRGAYSYGTALEGDTTQQDVVLVHLFDSAEPLPGMAAAQVRGGEVSVARRTVHGREMTNVCFRIDA